MVNWASGGERPFRRQWPVQCPQLPSTGARDTTAMLMRERNLASESPQPASPWRRRLRWVAALALLAATAFAGFIGFVYYRSGGAMQSAFAETEDLDPGWRLDDIEAQRVVVPDAENAALKI